MIKNTNDGIQSKPYLRLDINYGTCVDLPEFSSGPRGSDEEKHKAIKAAGFAGVQDSDPKLCRDLGLERTAHARMNRVGDLDSLVPQWKKADYNCATLHVGWGMESDRDMDALVEYVMSMSAQYDFPLYIETHRATITQDLQRTVELTKRFPDIRFNGDFSHWYTGLEMVYGGIENKWEFIALVFERVRLMHGRIGNPGSILVDIADGKNQVYVDHFREMWTCAFAGFLQTAQPGDYLCFTVELLPPAFCYARLITNELGKRIEEGDRWQQALLYLQIAQTCWEQAKARVN